jgi:hypothetical protein
MFASDMRGQFLMRYETGELSEILLKEPGTTVRVPVFPGTLWVEAEGPGAERRQRLELASGEHVRLYNSAGWQPRRALGHEEMRISAKGQDLPDVVVAKEVPRLAALVELGYRFAWAPQHGTVPMHNGAFDLIFERGWLSMRLGGEFARASEQFDTWACALHRYAADLGVGVGRNLRSVRVTAAIDGQAAIVRTEYSNAAHRSQNSLGVGASLAAFVPLSGGPLPLFLDVQVAIMAEQVAPLALDSEPRWMAIPAFGIGLAGRAW